MWLLKKEKEKKAAEEAKAKGKTSSAPKGSKDSQGSDVDLRYDGPDPRYVDDGPASPKDGTGRRRSLGGDPSSPKSGGPASPPPGRQRRMSFDASANADLVKNALGDVNNIIAKAAEQQKEGARPRRASFSGSMPGAPDAK